MNLIPSSDHYREYITNMCGKKHENCMIMLFRSGEQVNGDYSQLNNIDWNKDTVDRFQELVDTSTQQLSCGGSVSKQ